MVSSDATPKLIRQAQIQADSSLGGGLEKKLNDLESYGATGMKSGASFAISHIPIVGPGLAKVFDIASDIGINNSVQSRLLRRTWFHLVLGGGSAKLWDCSQFQPPAGC